MATGIELIKSLKPNCPMRVVAFMAEDPTDETHRRFNAIVQNYGLDEAEQQLTSENLRLYAGQSEPLVEMGAKGPVATNRYIWLKNLCNSFKPDIVILDPKSRWQTLDENSNDHATRFVALLEDLVRPNNGTVIISHHVTKSAKNIMDSASARGASSFVDACRLFFNMIAPSDKNFAKWNVPGNKGEYVILSTTKQNYAAHLSKPIYLRRGDNGVLVVLDIVRAKKQELAKVISKELADTGSMKKSDLISPRTDESKSLRDRIKKQRNFSRKDMESAIAFGIKNGLLQTQETKSGGRPATMISSVIDGGLNTLPEDEVDVA